MIIDVFLISDAITVEVFCEGMGFTDDPNPNILPFMSFKSN